MNEFDPGLTLIYEEHPSEEFNPDLLLASEETPEDIGFNPNAFGPDPEATAAQGLRSILSDVSSEFGMIPEDRAEPRTDVPLGVGRNTRSIGRWIQKYLTDPIAASEDEGFKAWLQNWYHDATIDEGSDAKRIMRKLVEWEQQYPDIAASPAGKRLRADLEERIRVAKKTEETDYAGMMRILVDMAAHQPEFLLDTIGNELIADPSLIVVPGAVFGGTLRAMRGLERTGKFGKTLRNMKMSSKASTRYKAMLIEHGLESAAVGVSEGALGAGYQLQRNITADRDPYHNVHAMTALGAALGVGIKQLGGLHQLVRHKRGAYRNFKDAIEDIAMEAGWQPAEVIRYLTQNMDELPLHGMVKDLLEGKIDKARYTTPDVHEPPYPGKGKIVDKPIAETIEDIKARAYDIFQRKADTSAEWLEGIFEYESGKSPVVLTEGKTPLGSKVLYNLQRIAEDYESGLNFLRGLRQTGKLATTPEAYARRKALAEFDYDYFQKWIQRKGGESGYGEFLIRYHTNMAKYTKESGRVKKNRLAMEETLRDMGADPKMFWRRGVRQRISDKLEATTAQAAKTAEQILTNPNLLYRGLKDRIIDPIRDASRFTKDMFRRKDQTPEEFKMQKELQALLRDWQGNRMVGELEINRFAEAIRQKISDPQRREAVSHYLEDNLEVFNIDRIQRGLERIDLTPEEIKLTHSIRQYFNDMLEWAQKAELFQMMRDDAGMFHRAQQIHRKIPSKIYKDDRYIIPDAEIWSFLEDVADPVGLAYRISSKKARDAGEGIQLKRRRNYVPHVVKRMFAPTEKDLMEWSISDLHRAGQLQTRSRFTKERTYETLQDVKEAGLELYTEDIASLISMYGKSMMRSQLNKRLIHQMFKIRTPEGYPLITMRGAAPEHYVEFKHPNFVDRNGEYMFVHPNLAPDLRLYFDTANPTIANRVLQNIVLISKRAALGLSGFHMMALAWSALATGQSPVNVIKNLLPLGPRWYSEGMKALVGKGEAHDTLMLLMRNGLGIGVIEELKGDTLINAMRNIAHKVDNTLANLTYVKPIGRVVSTGIRGVARAQEIIDKHLWDHVNTGMKATTALTVFEKMVLQDAKIAEQTGRLPTNLNIIAQRAAQFTNDAFGNQNWEQMAMNVNNRMGHRLAAALNKPSTRGYIRMLVFAPDWTLSNMRVMGKAVTGFAPMGRKELAHSEYLKYAARSAFLFAMLGEVLQQVAGEGSFIEHMEEGKGLRPQLGDNKELEISKQLTEVFHMLADPLDAAYRKSSMPVKVATESEGVMDALTRIGESSLPITGRQMARDFESGLKGAMGMPEYPRYD